ncbi:MAG: SgcJ/EcaC family oxidoreductase [Planctomycetaceae bacterium]|nr:SgcJ/EcaC family oxidoreductase [Planctomycetaceae bacterium]
MQRFLITMSAATLLIAAAAATAQDAANASQGRAQQIRQLLDVLEDSFGRGDAKRLSACWTAGGDFAGQSNQRIEGRENIEKTFRGFFATRKNITLKLHVASLRIASDDLVLLDANSQVKLGDTGKTEDSLLSLVLVKRDGRWLIERARETDAPAPSPAQHLSALQWMVGDWADNVSPQAGLSIHSTCDWTANRNFLIRKYKIEGKDVSRTGTEVIGWDPRTQRIHSWVFDSEGGFGESIWVQDGNRWLASYRGVRPDGSDVSATNIFTIVDASTVTIQSNDRTVGGERQPNVPEVTIKRQPTAKPAANPAERVQPPHQVLP